MVIRQRARKHEHKLERRDAMLDAALALWGETSFQQITMAAIAERSGVAKGTLYLYFQTKEQLFLALLDRMLDEWFESVDRTLTRAKGPWSSIRLATVLSSSLAERDLLTRLLTMLEGVLEHNIDVDTARAFKTRLLKRTTMLGTLIEKKLPFLPPGHGARLLLHLRALLTGLRQMADCAPAVKQVIRETVDMAVFDVDFARELQLGMVAIVVGFEQSASSSAQ